MSNDSPASLPPVGSAGVADLSARTKLRLTGADRVRFLHGQVSSDVRALRPGQAHYACVMTAKGKMCADIFVHAEADALLLDADESLREELSARLERYLIADDVVIHDVTDELALLHVLPPRPDGWPVQRFGADGSDHFVPVAERASFLAEHGLRVFDEAELEARRIAAGVPRWGLDLAPDTIPVEAGLEERAISYTKGCYIGQEVISRIKSIGQVNHRLVRLRAATELRVGEKLLTVEGTATGEVTSACPSPDGAGWIALGYVRRAQAERGTRVQAGEAAAEVW